MPGFPVSSIMRKNLSIVFTSREEQGSNYDWAHIYLNTDMIGKCRCTKDDENKTLIIHTINIFPDYQRHGFGSEIVNEFKKDYHIIIADRVRYKAKDFWINLGFSDDGTGNYIFRR